jgi:hypothetical protein
MTKKESVGLRFYRHLIVSIKTQAEKENRTFNNMIETMTQDYLNKKVAG